MPSFEGQVCLVTGGGSGIGFAAALGFLKANAKHVVIASRKEERLKKAVEALQKAANVPAHKVSYEILNIRDEGSVKQCIANVVTKHSSLDILVNNGGGQFAAPANQFRLRGWKSVIDTNLNGTWMITRAAYDATEDQRMNQGKQLSIVTVTVENIRGFPGMTHTGAARAGIENFSMSLATEWGPHNVRINTVAPGIILSSGIDNYPEELRPAFIAAAANNPLGRGGTESECASAILYLCSKEAAYITGACLRVDGGSSLRKPVLAMDMGLGDDKRVADTFHYNKELEEGFIKRQKQGSKL